MSLKVGVLMGGPSEEREVSLSTGMAVIDACQKIGYNPTEISFDQDYKSYLPKMKKLDIIFNALHGGIGENGKIQIWMDKNQIKYTGSDSYSSALCMDKAKSKNIALDNGNTGISFSKFSFFMAIKLAYLHVFLTKNLPVLF